MARNVLDDYVFFLRYALVGLASFCVDSGTYWMLLTIWGNEQYLLFYFVSHIVAFGVNLSGHKLVTYRGHAVRNVRSEVVLHALLKVGNFTLSMAVLFFLVDGLGWPPKIGIAVNALLAFWSLIASCWIFAALHPKESIRTLGCHVRRILAYTRSLFRFGPLA